MITLLRVLFGFIVACLVAGLVTVAFVVTPADIAGLPAEAQPERLGNAGVLSLLAATHSAIFAFPFAIIAIGIAEMSAIRSWLYYAFVGVAHRSWRPRSRVRQRGCAASRRSSTAMRWRPTSPWASPAVSPTGWWPGAALAASGRMPRRPPCRRRPIPNRLHSRIEPRPGLSRAIVLLHRSNQFSFLRNACGGKEIARRMLDPDLQQRFASRCTDAALGYSAASTAAYAAFADQVLNFWSAVLQPPAAKPQPAAQLWNWPVPMAPPRRRRPRPSSIPSIHSIGCCRQPPPPKPARAGPADQSVGSHVGVRQRHERRPQRHERHAGPTRSRRPPIPWPPG